jgi:sporulation protein YlmC with PRC-barrel domain
MNVTPLTRLSRSLAAAAHPDADLRGRAVRDRCGAEIGCVVDLLVDCTDEVRFLLVEDGRHVGFGAATFHVPVELVAAVGQAVELDCPGGEVAGSPRFDPAIADLARFYDAVYVHYGLVPAAIPLPRPADGARAERAAVTAQR